ncbi:Transcriptional regulatory protein, C terminal [Roseovarius lutimaris]|uniref:Transcriptional regulatory protein, C terminal n=1 Tax=Roseovarius lutimaris TaxID=1005928 RepID=A0A1I4Z2I1_9RHOB|nr:response regulator transcription factor [Roseovarius lutimaris]SFN44485.1 Transcriptional regulatory protein, C terminal [Roseovarius lutimaris]
MDPRILNNLDGVVAIQRLTSSRHEGQHDQAELLRGTIIEQGFRPHNNDVKSAHPEVNSLVGIVAYDFNCSSPAQAKLAGLRIAHPQLPILVVGRSGDDDVRVAAFEAGADNFLPANCNRLELAIKIRRLGLMRNSHPPAITIDDLQIWPSTRFVARGGVPIKLSDKEMGILSCLAAAAPNVVDRATLLKEVFKLNFDPGTNNVEVHVHRLRQKIDKGYAVRLINTARNVGYFLGLALTGPPLAPRS